VVRGRMTPLRTFKKKKRHPQASTNNKTVRGCRSSRPDDVQLHLGPRQPIGLVGQWAEGNVERGHDRGRSSRQLENPHQRGGVLDGTDAPGPGSGWRKDSQQAPDGIPGKPRSPPSLNPFTRISATTSSDPLGVWTMSSRQGCRIDEGGGRFCWPRRWRLGNAAWP